jgi:hypothetical protein
LIPGTEFVSRRVGLFSQQGGQLRNIRCDQPRLIAREQAGSRSPAGLILEIDIRQCLPVVVAHDETGVGNRRQSKAVENGAALQTLHALELQHDPERGRDFGHVLLTFSRTPE